MLNVTQTNQFKRDIRKIKNNRKTLELIQQTVQKLILQEKLPFRNKDHALKGDWGGHRECHIEPDWLLIYRVDAEACKLELVRTGTHSDLFG